MKGKEKIIILKEDSIFMIGGSPDCHFLIPNDNHV